jgi:4-amino-4-deoxychorismate lyase
VVPATDRGLAFGDGVFRTVAVRAGRPLNWPWHARRLGADCKLLEIEAPDEATLVAELARVAPGDAVVKLIVTRGSSARGFGPAGATSPRRIVAAFPSPPRDDARARDGVAVRRCSLVLSEQPRLAGAETLNRLENVIARGEWSDPAISEGLLCDAAGRVVEGTMSNLFVARGGRLATPDLKRCGVVGAQRESLRELLAAAGVACEVRDIAWTELESADEAFLTNSLIGAWPITRLGGRKWEPGPFARQAQSLIATRDARA